MIGRASDRVIVGGHVDKDDRFIAPTLLDYGADLAQFRACEAMQDANFGLNPHPHP